MDFGFSFDAAPTIDMVLYFGVLEMLAMISDGGVQMDFGFSFDAAPTIDMVLYFRVETKEDGDGC